MKPLHVGKVGGSLFDVPDLGTRLKAWINSHPAERILLIPGGGPAADVIRRLQIVHELDDEAAHWLAIRAMSLTAHFVASLLDLPVLQEPGVADAAVLDVAPFLMTDQPREGSLGHSWNVTSDSIAARFAQVQSARLTLFKSVELPADLSWAEAAEAGLVDRTFPTIAGQLDVNWVNLRAR